MKKRTTQGGPGEREAGGKDRVRSAADQEILFSSNEIANDAKNPSRKSQDQILWKTNIFCLQLQKVFGFIEHFFF